MCVIIVNEKEDGYNFIVRCNLDNISAGDIVKKIVEPLDGKGGGSNTFAQGGAPISNKLDKVLEELEETL